MPGCIEAFEYTKYTFEIVGRRQEKGKGGPGSRKSERSEILSRGYLGGFLFPFLPSLGPAISNVYFVDFYDL